MLEWPDNQILKVLFTDGDSGWRPAVEEGQWVESNKSDPESADFDDPYWIWMHGVFNLLIKMTGEGVSTDWVTIGGLRCLTAYPSNIAIARSLREAQRAHHELTGEWTGSLLPPDVVAVSLDQLPLVEIVTSFTQLVRAQYAKAQAIRDQLRLLAEQ